jgi:hypothetical protein
MDGRGSISRCEAARLAIGPTEKAALVKRIPLKTLNTFYGPLQIGRIDFTVTSDHEKDAKDAFAELVWHISFKQTGHRIISMTVEPFEGAVVGLSEDDDRDDLVEYRRKHHGRDPKK